MTKHHPPARTEMNTKSWQSCSPSNPASQHQAHRLRLALRAHLVQGVAPILLLRLLLQGVLWVLQVRELDVPALHTPWPPSSQACPWIAAETRGLPAPLLQGHSCCSRGGPPLLAVGGTIGAFLLLLGLLLGMGVLPAPSPLLPPLHACRRCCAASLLLVQVGLLLRIARQLPLLWRHLPLWLLLLLLLLLLLP